MDECMWIGCVDPPEPPFFKVKSDWDGFSVYEFGETATYTCEDAGLFFEDDRAKKSFTLKCLDNGKWEEPSPWPMCVSGEDGEITCKRVASSFLSWKDGALATLINQTILPLNLDL